MLAIKQNLAQGRACCSWNDDRQKFHAWHDGTTSLVSHKNDYDMNGFGGHCMCVISYDDYLEGGAFQIMNS